MNDIITIKLKLFRQKKESPKKIIKFETYFPRSEVLEGIENKTLIKVF